MQTTCQSTTLCFAVTCLIALSCSKPSPAVLTLAPAGMNPSGNPLVSPDGVVAFWSNGTLRSKLNLKKGPVTITLRACGNVVDGEAPIVIVSLEGREVGTLVIASPVLKDYVVNAHVHTADTMELVFSFNNHIDKLDRIAGRHLKVAMVTVASQGS